MHRDCDARAQRHRINQIEAARAARREIASLVLSA